MAIKLNLEFLLYPYTGSTVFSIEYILLTMVVSVDTG